MSKQVAILVIVGSKREQRIADALRKEGTEVYTANGDPLEAFELLHMLSKDDALCKKGSVKLIASKGVIQASGQSVAEQALVFARDCGMALETKVLSSK